MLYTVTQIVHCTVKDRYRNVVFGVRVGCSFSFGGKKKKVSKRQQHDPAGDLK